jgi:hypothetical protein
MTELTPETLSALVAHGKGTPAEYIVKRVDIDAHADAWKNDIIRLHTADAKMLMLEFRVAELESQVAALREALWFEQYKDAYPDGGVNHGDCAACRLLLHAARREEAQRCG